MRAGLASLAARAAKASSSSSLPKTKPKPSPPPSLPKTKPKHPSGENPILKTCTLSPALAKVLDVSEITRQGALKKVWAYIKDQKLQNQLDKREINCDDNLKGVFGQDKVTITELLKLLSPHISKKV